MITNKELMEIRKKAEAEEAGKIIARKKAEKNEKREKERIRKEREDKNKQKEADEEFINLATGKDNFMGRKMEK